MNESPSRLKSEQGAILVFTAIAIVVLMGFLTFVVDQGVVWVSRAQAQNAADAGALAGAIARAFDDTSSEPVMEPGEKVYDSAKQTAETNTVWKRPPLSPLGDDIVAQVFRDCPKGVTGSCVRVDVFRGALDREGNPQGDELPLFFGPVLNIATHGVRATATAIVGIGNSTNCMRPWAVADQWQDVVVNNPKRFDRWTRVGPNVVELTPRDIFTPADENGAGTGFRLPRDYGVEQVMKGGNNPNAGNVGAITPGWFLPLRLPDPSAPDGFTSGGDPYRDAIATCIGHPVTIGQYLPTENGAMNGPTDQGFTALKAKDFDAYWNGTEVAESCAPGCAPFSPRVVPITVFDMDEFQWRKEGGGWDKKWIPGVGPSNEDVPGGVCPTGGGCVRVVNILGFFADRMDGNDVIGYLMSYPGEFVVGAPSLGGGAGFLRTIQLIR